VIVFLVSRRRWLFFLSLPCNEEFDYRVTPIEDVDEAKKVLLCVSFINGQVGIKQ